MLAARLRRQPLGGNQLSNRRLNAKLFQHKHEQALDIDASVRTEIQSEFAKQRDLCSQVLM